MQHVCGSQCSCDKHPREMHTPCPQKYQCADGPLLRPSFAWARTQTLRITPVGTKSSDY